MKLTKILKSDNVLEGLTKKEKESILAEVKDFKAIDSKEHDKRVKGYESILEASKSRPDDAEKNFPWDGASNIKYPLIISESNTASSMLATALLQDEIVKGVVVGNDEVEVKDENNADGTAMQPLGKKERAERVAKYTNHLLKYVIPDWEDNQDYTMNRLAFLGAQFKKTYWDAMDEVVKSELINFKDIIISDSATLESAERITHKFELTQGEIIGRQRAGIYCECEMDELDDADKQYDIYETHLYYDLDDDGIKEPYIFTYMESGEMLSIQKRFDEEMVRYNGAKEVITIEAEQYFTKYGFIRDSENPIYDIGFGQLLMPMNKTVNTLINQLIDAGTLANTSGGIISGGSGIKSGNSMRIKMGEWKILPNVMEIKNNIMPISGQEPSPTLYSLLGTLTQATKDITSIKNLNPESMNANTPATTTLLMLEQGINEFKAIYERVRRAEQEEVKKILYFIRKYGSVDDYLEIMDFGKASAEDLEKEGDYEIVPVNTSNSLTNGQTMLRANAVYEMAVSGNQFMNLEEATEFRLKALKVEGYSSLMQEAQTQQPNPVEEAMTKNQIDMGQVQVKLLDAQAKSIQDKSEIDKLTLQLNAMKENNKARNENIKTETTAMKTLVETQAIDSDLSQEKEVVKEIRSKDLSGTLGREHLKQNNPFGGTDD